MIWVIGGKNQKVVGLVCYLCWLGLLDCLRLLGLLDCLRLLDLLGLFGAIGLFGGGWADRVVEVVWLACMVRLVRLLGGIG